MEDRIFLSAIIIGIVSSLIAATTNLFLSPTLPSVIIPIALAFAMLFLYYFVRFKRIVEPLKFPAIFVSFLGISTIWVFNGGMNGSNVMPGLVMLFLALFVVTDKKKIVVLLLFLAMNIFIYLLQFYHPELITSFPTVADQWIDSIFTLICTSIIIYVIVKFFHRKYISERVKSAENENKYRLSEANLEEAQRMAHIGSWEWDLISNTMKWSKELYRVLDTLPDLFVNTPDYLLKVIHPDDAEHFKTRMNGNLQNQNSSPLECRIIHRDGSVHHVLTEVSMKFDGNNRHVRSVGTVQDITDRKFAEQKLIIAKEQAVESDNLKTAFLNNISHEIRTPFNSILGFLSIIQDNELTNIERNEYIGFVNKSSHRLMNTINDIVEISQIQAGQMKRRESDTNIKILTDQMVRRFMVDVDYKKLEFKVKNTLPSTIESIFTDRIKLNAILTNLIVNAIKFTKTGSIELGVCLKNNSNEEGFTSGDPYEVEFSVTDTGIGIPKNKLPIIFERFMQADVSNTRLFEGSGLGLSIAKAYVELLGGSIHVKSEEGKGSIFYFTVPYYGENPLKQENKPVEWINIAEIKDKAIKILIAEDDEDSALLISMVVKMFAEEVYLVKTGIEAIEACRNHPDLDLLLMDIKMPEMDGYEATSYIRQFNPDVVIIAQTAYALSGDREKAIIAGCNDYIAKPIMKEQLILLLQKYIRKNTVVI